MSKCWSDVVRLGEYSLKNRVLMCALTRVRCETDGIPTDLVAEYYSQRTGAGLMLTEATSISQRGIGFPGQASIYTKQQAEGWKKVLKKVHAKGGLMYLQAFHAGRTTHPSLNGGLEPWAPSSIPNREKIAALKNASYPTPKELTLEEIETLKQEYEAAFVLAKETGFDGIQLHGSLGYILDQFLRSFTNQRNDHYGGKVENRARFPLQIIDIALKHFQPYQVAIKLSPTSRIQDMFDENPIETYSYFLTELNKRKIGLVELLESAKQPIPPRPLHQIKPKDQIAEVCKTFRPYFNGLIVGNFGFTPETGIKAINEGYCDAISFGKSYISHPDLAERIIGSVKLDNKLDLSSLYWDKKRDKSVGYTDYSFHRPS